MATGDADNADNTGGFDPSALCGWRPTPEAELARWSRVYQPWEYSPEYEQAIKRTVAWEVLEQVGGAGFYRLNQVDGDCVAWGATKAMMATMAWEIVRLGQSEEFHHLHPSYTYGVSRNAPEGGNGEWKRWPPDRAGNRAGSLGSWVAATIVHGVLRSDYVGVPAYSEKISREWGEGRGYDQFVSEAVKRPFKSATRIRSGDELVQAICNGYFCSIAGNREFSNQLTARGGKGWYGRGNRYPHQTSIHGYDDQPEPCVYDSNQWPGHATGQTDGPNGGGWRTLEYVDRELRSGDVECFAFSQFDGFPAEDQKPDFSVGA